MTLNDFQTMTESEFAQYMNARNMRTLSPEQVERVERERDADDFTPAERMSSFGV